MKNPMLSVWLSAANAWGGAARGLWSAELHRQQTAIATELTRQMLRFWTAPWLAPARASTRRERR